MKWLKQLFCSHLWKVTGMELLDSYYKGVGSIPFKKIEKYARTDTCIRCGKIKLSEYVASKTLSSQERLDVYKQITGHGYYE